ncbi:MAG: glycosyltransferase family 2 protein [Coleofasciculus sp. G3-WIS-01]|uniref:glycosyltransferase family 2 protein n=1 Tax=Coleofasciculus sp. G3-WIS-01 TaxID=3069528 RepID=UPI0032FF5AA7
MTHPSTILIIPCYNEENNIDKLLREIQKLNLGYDTLVIDDGSQDNTYAVASKLSPCVKLLTNLGIGGAVQTGIKYALQHNYELCVQVDGDGQHPPSQVYRLIESYLTSPANLIIGSRFLRKKEFKSTWKRRIGIRIISGVIQWLFQYKITDPTSGLRIMDRKAIQLFSTEYPHDFPEPISLAVALERGLRVREVSVNMRSREQGFSSITGIKSFLYMIRVIGYLILVRMGRHI